MENITFDALFTTAQLQMLKLLLPLFPNNMRGQMAVFIKMQELIYTMNYIRQSPGGIINGLSKAPDGNALMDAMLPYCSDSQKEELRRFQNTYQQMGQLQEMMETLQTMQELFPEGMNPQSMDFGQMAEMMSGLQNAAGGAPFGEPATESTSSQTGGMNPDTGFPHFTEGMENQQKGDSYGTMDD